MPVVDEIAEYGSPPQLQVGIGGICTQIWGTSQKAGWKGCLCQRENSRNGERYNDLEDVHFLTIQRGENKGVVYYIHANILLSRTH